MKLHKKYTDIVRLGHKSTQGVLNVGDYITITEKLDGANASFTLDEDSPIGLSCYSRNTPLSPDNTLRGFYGWVELLSQQSEKPLPRYRYFGEWLCSHKVVYKPEAYSNFYLFSIYDELSGEYLSDAVVKSEATRLGLKTPEYFYEGQYISFEHLQSFVGKSNLTLTPDTGEGVVVKNVSYRDRFGNQIFVKLVSESFAEIQKQKLPKDPSKLDAVLELAKSVVTPPRVEKILFKCVDEGLINSEFGIENMGEILKLTSPLVFEDVVKEELDLFENIELDNIKKACGKILPMVIKEVLKNK